MSNDELDQEESLAFYKGEGYLDINSYLRKNSVSIDHKNLDKSNYIIEHIINIDNSMSNNTLNETFYRGVEGLELFIKEQGILVNKSFTSCSFNIENTLNFAGKQCCIIMFKIPSEIKSFNYGKVKRDYENEFLIQRNTQFVNFRYIKNYDGIGLYSAILKLYANPAVTIDNAKSQQKMIHEIKRVITDEDDEALEEFLKD